MVILTVRFAVVVAVVAILSSSEPGCVVPSQQEEPTITGRKDMRTGRGGEAAGLWHGRDSTLFRWRGCAGPTLVALRRRCAPSEGTRRQQTTRTT
jgi:hypothetical protein